MNEERLQKIIANRGAVSRRKAEKLIVEGRVKVNGQTVTELGFKTSVDAQISIDNQPIVGPDKKYYFLFNKPRFVLTTMSDPKKRATVADYFKKVPVRVYPVGRLDYDVSGLLLMTNDGEFANFVMHPRYEFFKTYQALIRGNTTKSQIKSLINGVVIDDDYQSKAINAKLLNFNQEKNASVIELTLAEGRKHHVKKMIAAAGLELEKLKRTQIEFLTDQDLKIGEYRALTPHEVKRFYGFYQSVKRKNDWQVKPQRS